MPGYITPGPADVTPPIFDIASGLTGGSYGRLDPRRSSNGNLNSSRKRSYNDREGDGDSSDLQYGRSDRSIKLVRRGGRGARGDSARGRPDYLGGRGGRGGGLREQNFSTHGIPGLAQSPPLPFPLMPPLPPELPFDPNDMGSIMALQAMGVWPPGPSIFQPAGGQQPPSAEMPAVRKTRGRCRDYDTKGFCTRGNSCPYEHGMDHIVVPGEQDEYDPKNSVMMDILKTTDGTNGNNYVDNIRGNDRGRGRGRGRGDRGAFTSNRRGRADFSHAGPNHDRSISSIVVEQIPEEKFDELSVREFFSQFGSIIEVQMQAYKRLAIVKYDDYGAAKRAYESPKVIFDNRFVKVYWYKPDALPTPPANGAAKTASPSSKTEEQSFDKEQFERDTAAAQKRLEEKQKKLKETEMQRQALEKQKEELAKMQQEEKKKLLEKLAAKGVGKAVTSSSGAPETAEDGAAGTGDKKASAQTEALRAQLAALEAEARSLGLDTTLTDDSYSYRGRGRGRAAQRGWGIFPPRGRGFDPSRGGYRARGAPFGGRGGSVYRLDNRTKKVAVSGVTFDTAKDEGLRQYLLVCSHKETHTPPMEVRVHSTDTCIYLQGIGEYETIEPNPDRKDSQLVTFKDRFTAEKFMYGDTDIPSVGKVELAWVNTPLPPVGSATAVKQQDGDAHMPDRDGDGSGSATATVDGGVRAAVAVAEVDYDVAEDDDRWMAE